MLWNTVKFVRTSPALVFLKFNSNYVRNIRNLSKYSNLTENQFRPESYNNFIKHVQPVVRYYSQGRRPNTSSRNTSVLYYASAIIILAVGLSYAAVPLYRIFCQAYSYGGVVSEKSKGDIANMKRNKDREIVVEFTADINANLNWNFKPQQSLIKVVPGETALAFYTAENPSDQPVVGVSTYNIVPFEAGQYFNKIQCFCFEEQMLNPHEQVDMPVFFYIDPEFAEDPKMETVNHLVLSYTFFQVKEGMNLPFPSYYKQHNR